MLSLFNVSSGQNSAIYYESADDYYMAGECVSSWWGAGAKILGLVGEVESSDFSALLQGYLPTGETLSRGASGRRGGTDGTFSAPKSVSLQALVGEDLRIVVAHLRAVDRALAYAENLIACRITENGVTRSERTGNLVVARFNHDLSRALDPQLHTHCVMINATRREDGQWRATDNQLIYRHKMFLGVLYRSELARELQALGYEIRLTHADGRFELAHISRRQVKIFSQRSAAIEAYLDTHGTDRDDASAWDKKLVAVITREKKTDVDRAVLRQEWDELSAAQNIDYRLPTFDANKISKISTEFVLKDAIEHLSERESVFDEHRLLHAALERGVGYMTLLEIKLAVDAAVQSGTLVHDGTNYTTREAQMLEQTIQEIEVRGRATLSPIYEDDRASLNAQLANLSEGQCDAVRGILLTMNQIIGVQGRAGAGKTTLLKISADQARANGYVVKGLAPSANAARELTGAGIDAETISAFITRKTKKLDARTLLIVDEAGMTSTRQMHAILTAASDVGCRVVLVGDIGQLNSVEAGKPFFQLQKNGMHTTAVNQIQRQKNQSLKQAVELVVDGQIAMAITMMDKNVTEIANAGERFERIANDYVALPAHERATTRVIAGTRSARREINRWIRSKLGLTDLGIAVMMLDRKDHTSQQARSILSYDEGDVVLAENDYPSLGMDRGDTAKVIERADSYIVLERIDGGRTTWHPALATNLTAYVAIRGSLTLGDLVRVTANDRKRGLVNGDIAYVDAIQTERQTLSLRLSNGKVVQLDYRKPLALDHGYCSTVHSSQGQTCDRVLIEADTHSLTSNEKTFYVGISRARDHAHIYTDDLEMLPLAMGRQNENTAALDVQPKPLKPVNELGLG